MLWSYKKCQEIGVGRGLEQFRTKNLFAQTIPDKIFGTKWSTPVKLNKKKKKFDICFRVFFNSHLKNLSS